MSGQRRAFWAILLVALIAALGYRMYVFGERSPPKPKIAFIASGSGPYWQAIINGAKAAARDKNVDLRISIPEKSENLDEQVEILSKLDLRNLDGIALSPIDAERQTQTINEWVNRQKKVVTFDSDAPLSSRHSYVGTNNSQAGQTCALLVKEALPEGGKIVVLLANLTKANMLDRKSGFEEWFPSDADATDDAPPVKYEVVGYFSDDGSDEKCATIIRDKLTEHPDLACFVGMTARHGPILLKVLRDADRLGQIKIIAFDDAEETLDGIEAGNIYATVVQDPFQYAYDAVTTLASLCRTETGLPIVGKGTMSVAAVPIKKRNLDDFRARLKARQQETEQQSPKKKAD